MDKLPEYLAITENEVIFSQHIYSIHYDCNEECLRIETNGGAYELKEKEALNLLLQFPIGYFQNAHGIDQYLDALVDKYGYEED